jgi:hypothetical protein
MNLAIGSSQFKNCQGGLYAVRSYQPRALAFNGKNTASMFYRQCGSAKELRIKRI